MYPQFKTIENSQITKILRNDDIFIFYDKSNIYSFVSCYLIYKYFESSNQLQKIHLIQVNNPDDLLINRYKFHDEIKNGSIIFLDCPITKETISFYIRLAKRIIVIDDQESSYKITLKSIVDSIYSKENKKKVNFVHTKGFCSPCSVWSLLTKDEPIKEILMLQDLYKRHRFKTNLTDLDLTIPTLIGNNFSELEDFLSKSFSTLSFLDNCFGTVNYVLKNIYKNCIINSFTLNVGKLKALCINLSKEDDRVLNYLRKINPEKLECDIIVTFTQLEKSIVGVISTDNKELNLLETFKKLNPIGNSDRIEFYSRKKITELFK